MFKKKIISLIIIALIAISSIGACNAKAKPTDIQIKFENHHHSCYNQIILYSITGNVIYDIEKYSLNGIDRTFTIPKEKVKNAKYMDVKAKSSNRNFVSLTGCTHHIILSDEFKQTIPDKITFISKMDYETQDWYDSWSHEFFQVHTQHLDLHLWNHDCKAYGYFSEHNNICHKDNNVIEYIFKKWG